MRVTLTRRLVAIVVATALLATAVAVYLATRSTAKSAPPWVGARTACRSVPLAHVHNPQRLTLLNSCATVIGTVKEVKLVAAYDDLKITIVPDRTTQRYLRKSNNGLLVADVIATDQAQVTAPPVGSGITAWGSWVLDRATKAAQLLPTYRIEINQREGPLTVLRGHSVEKHGPPVARTLQLSMKASDRVIVGGRIDVAIQTRWRQNRTLMPAPQIRLFAEMTTTAGVGVRWKAVMTDTQGNAALHLVSLQKPAQYTLTVYATPSRQPVTASATVLVAKK